ncbi:cytochrome c biogenesis protein CcsA [Psychrobacter sp. HD31]|uniref:cytochrome C assembly family protein n=1 Tax=Psychrobacter sp. HD31 TaxID=3112003 RepID=UPI003DA48359
MMTAYVIASLCYISISFWLLYCLYHKRAISKPLAIGLLTIGLCLHAWLLYPNIITPNGLNFNVFNTLSLTSLFLLTFFLLFSLIRPIYSLGILAAPAAFFGITAGFFGHAPYKPLANISAGLQTHILLSIAAYSLLLMCAVQAIILRLQIRELKHRTRHRLWVSKLPPLQSMENLLFDMLVLGFVLLSFALLLGFVYVDDFFAQHLAHKTVFSILSWLMFAYLIFGHWRFGWRGKHAANMTVFSFLLLAIGFVGSKAVLELIL